MANEFLSNPSFTMYAACASVSTLQLLILSGATGARRGKDKSVASPEDARSDETTWKETVSPAVARLLRTHRNALENIPIGLIIGLVYVLAGAGSTWVAACMGLFSMSRLLHSLFYLRAVQPWRSVCYTVGLVTMGVMAVHTLVLVWSACSCAHG